MSWCEASVTWNLSTTGIRLKGMPPHKMDPNFFSFDRNINIASCCLMCMRVFYGKLVLLKTEVNYEKSVFFSSLTKILFCNHI